MRCSFHLFKVSVRAYQAREGSLMSIINPRHFGGNAGCFYSEKVTSLSERLLGKLNLSQSGNIEIIKHSFKKVPEFQSLQKSRTSRFFLDSYISCKGIEHDFVDFWNTVYGNRFKVLRVSPNWQSAIKKFQVSSKKRSGTLSHVFLHSTK